MRSQIVQRVLDRVNEKLIKDYTQDGAVCIRQILTLEEIELLRHGVDLNLKNPSSRSKIVSKKEESGFFIEDFCNWQNNSYYRDFIFNSPVGVVAGLLMKSRTTKLYHDHLLVKEAFTKQSTIWHQDQPYYNIEGRQNCSIWIPIDPISRESTLEFVSGSHLGPWYIPRAFKNGEAKWFPEGSLADIPDIEANRTQYPIIGWEVQPGDIVCFHMLTLHAAGGVHSNQRRRVFSVRFLGDDITYAPRPWITSPEFPGLEEQLTVNSSLEHPLFPVLWQR